MAIKFNQHHVTDGTTKARVFYSLDNRTDGRKVVTMYAREYGPGLGKMFAGHVENNSDLMTDYIESDTVRLFEDHPLYAQARARVEVFEAARRAKVAEKRAANEARRLARMAA